MTVDTLGDPKTTREARVEQIATHLLSRAALLVRLLVKQVRNTEITRTEGEVLGILSGGPRRVTELAELEGVAQPTMTLLIKRLAERGWVTRAGLAGDGRVVIVSITAAGESRLEDFRAEFLAAMRTDLRQLSDRQLQELLRATETLSSFAETLQGARA